MLLGLRVEAQFVDVVDDVAQDVAAVYLVLDLAEDLADLVFDGVRAGRLLLEAVQVGKQLQVDEVGKVGAGLRGIVVELTVLIFWRGPSLPAVGRVEYIGIFSSLQPGFLSFDMFQRVEIFQEQQP
jgi:hypothetical protein